jgi:HPt (histidine-containing phosphotransfer) domain-containing protein
VSLDKRILAGLRRLSAGTVDSLIEIFVRTAPEMLRELEAAVAANDAGRLVGAAHKLGGMSANIGARQLSARCARLQRAAASGSVPNDAADNVGAMVQEYEEAVIALKAWRAADRS